MRIAAAVKYDILFQFRHGFYYAYLLVGTLYVLILRGIPEHFKETVATLIIFTDPSVLGFFFIGGIVLMEKGQKTLENLFVTPLRLEEYIWSKLISLTVLSTLVSIGIIAIGYGRPHNPLALILGVILSSLLFTLIGIIASARAKGLDEYILASLWYMPIIFLPILEYLDLFTSPLFYIFPTKAALCLMQAAFSSIRPAQVIYAVSCLLVWTVPTFFWARNWFTKYIILGKGENKS